MVNRGEASLDEVKEFLDEYENGADALRQIASNAVPTTIGQVNLKGTIKGFGMTLAEEGRFFDWKQSHIARSASSFTKDELLKRGSTKARLEEVGEAYEHIARITPSNPSAAGRASQLRELLENLF